MNRECQGLGISRQGCCAESGQVHEHSTYPTAVDFSCLLFFSASGLRRSFTLLLPCTSLLYYRFAMCLS